MDRRAPAYEEAGPGDSGVGDSLGQNVQPVPPPAGEWIVETGAILARTVRHFWPELGRWLKALPDTRFEPYVVYDKPFLVWWGLLLFLCKLGSRRQLDYELRAGGQTVLANVNRLAGTHQESLPCHDTLDHFLGHVGDRALAVLRREMVRRLIRMRALESSRLLGRYVMLLDGTGFVVFNHRHCPRCLEQKTGGHTLYLHPVLEAKLATPEGLVLSLGTEHIENPLPPHESNLASYETIKQDCELKAFSRLAPHIKADFPQMRLCLSGDALYACGRAIQTCKDNGWDYVFTFKQGQMPAVWQEFQALLALSPQNTRRVLGAQGLQQVYRWVTGLTYTDDQGREHTFDAIECQETHDGNTKTFAWITCMKVTDRNVVAIATRGGRNRWKIENEGFNTQKNGGYNLEHAYAFSPMHLKAFYCLLQIAHMILQLVEKGSLLRKLAHKHGKTVVKLFGSIRNIARRLRDCLRFRIIPPDACDPAAAARIQIRFDSS